MQGISTETSYRENYIAPVINKYTVSQIKPVHFVTGEYYDRQGPTEMERRLKQISLEKCQTEPLWERLSSVQREICMGKAVKNVISNTKESSCFQLKPNRFLRNLKVEYPELYEKMKKRPEREVHATNETDVRRTTFQIDFGHFPEYPNALYSDDIPD